jgi:hypothetical protein
VIGRWETLGCTNGSQVAGSMISTHTVQ